MTHRTWKVARRYFFPVFGAGMLAILAGRVRISAVIFALAASVLYFFRDPERRPDGGHWKSIIYAPADGLITDVEEVEDETLGGAMKISIFLNLHNVHVNRSPVAGRVLGIQEIEGGYAPALFGGSGENYRLRTLLDGEFGRAVIVQKAGAIARRITLWISAGDSIESGQRIGVIHFGSRTDVLVPSGVAEPLVSPGDRVRAGVTEIARYREVAS